MMESNLDVTNQVKEILWPSWIAQYSAAVNKVNSMFENISKGIENTNGKSHNSPV